MCNTLGVARLWWKITNIYIVKDSGYQDILEPYNTVMVDCGFKIKYYLIFADVKGTSSDIRKTSEVANVRIFIMVTLLFKESD